MFIGTLFLSWAPEQIPVAFIYKLNMHIIQHYIKHLPDAFKMSS